MMSYAIRAAVESSVFDRVVVNGDHEIFGEIAHRYGAEFYLRNPELGMSDTQSDDVVHDFITNHPCDLVAWVNTINPFQTAQEIRRMVEHFGTRGLDSLISVENRQVHCTLGERPVNFRQDEKFALTQDLQPVQAFVYSLMLWRTEVFMRSMEERGHAFFCGRFGTYPVSRLTSVVIKTEEDLLLVDAMMRARRSARAQVAYYSAAPGPA